jgi:DNA-binding CsgD family transcriptional regulator
MAGASPSLATLVGRQPELAVAREFLRGLSDRVATPGQAGALVIQGPSGIGKTALWLAVCDLAATEGIRVLRARPAEAEATFSYAALGDLLREAMSQRPPNLPGPQQRTLERALGLAAADDAAVEPQLVHAATTNLLLALAAQSPVLLAVDDAPWLDPPTAAALEFAARRVGGRSVGFLVAQRADEESPAPFGLEAALPANPPHRLWLGPLSVAGLHRLLEERLGLNLARPHLVRLHTLSGGVPFHALQIAQALQRRPLPPIGAPWPIPASLRDLLLARIEALSPAALEVLRLVAAAGSLNIAAVEQVLGAAVARDGFAEVDHEFVSRDGDRLRAGHPLVASTAYEAMSDKERAAHHARLAGVVDDPEARARHRALAGGAPDEQVAAELEAAGARARARGAPDAAAELLHLARERTPTRDGEGYFRRSLALAHALAGADDLPAARTILDAELPRMGAGRTLGQAEMLRAEIDWYMATARDAVTHLEAGLRAARGEADVEADLHYRMAIFCDYDLPRGLENSRIAVELLERLENPAALSAALLQLFYIEVLLGLPPRMDLLERGLSIEPADSHVGTTIPGIWWLAQDMPVESRQRFATMLERDRRRGQLSSEADLLTRLAEVELFADNYGAAREYADAATSVARQHGDTNADPARRVRALVDAHEGKLDSAKAMAEQAATRAAAAGDHIIAVAWLVVMAFAAASEEDYITVEQVGAESAEWVRAIGIVEPMRLGVQHERLEALAALGRIDEAQALLTALEERQRLLPRPWLEAALVRGRARLTAAQGDLAAAARVTEAAMGASSAAWRRLDRGRVLFLRGQLLRRMRLRRESAQALDAAVAIFDALGAAAWAKRARAEAARLGRHRPGTAGLTAAEAQVAKLGAGGLTNRQIGERLSISPKTVEAHMSRIYGKLGIRSRAELGRRMAADDAAAGDHL